MGNCQAVDAAALVIQHPNGKLERMYWPLTASEVMKTNPGHYVSLIIPLPNNDSDDHDNNNKSVVRFTRVKLLRPTDTLVLGRAYRLVTTQEVMKVIRAKKDAKLKKLSQSGLREDLCINMEKQSTSSEVESGKFIEEKNGQDVRRDRHGQKSIGGRSKSWRPSLQSISESVS
ncbi:hypothetical protein ACJIZ3_005101 [Penstemon smallii]|uniref:Uncharacterized protein n=1 Tax=Penstemon smallii TaxID=265156 RepID=A0ABD3S3Y4_9LAMI